MNLRYLLKRLLLLVLVLWSAASLNFLVPRLTPRNPIQEKIVEMMQYTGLAGYTHGIEELAKSYEKRFGLDQPLWKQYVNYLADMLRLDLGYSLKNYPRTVMEIIGDAIPWTIGLLTVSTMISFVVGSLLGALMAWPSKPGLLKVVEYLATPFMMFSAVPYYVLALILIYLLGVHLAWFPYFGGYSVGIFPSRTFAFFRDVARHAVLPALSMTIASMGGRALNMRGMMVTIQGEDYMILAEAKGLTKLRVFWKYAIRNVLLTQVTTLALQLGFVVSGSVLVETVFGYPGMGSLLAEAIKVFDYFTIYGVVFFIILGIGVATLILDLLYPLLDPRIALERS